MLLRSRGGKFGGAVVGMTTTVDEGDAIIWVVSVAVVVGVVLDEGKAELLESGPRMEEK